MTENTTATETDVITKLSRLSVADTTSKLTGMITAKGMKLFGRDRPGGRGPPGRPRRSGRPSW